MRQSMLVLLGLSLGACTLGEPPMPEVIPPEVRATDLHHIQQQVDEVRYQVASLTGEVQALDVWKARVQRLESLSQPAPVKKVARKPQQSPSPVVLVQEAQREARVVPVSTGFHGKSGEYTYLWQPGKVYTVYLSPKQGTGIVLPPAEQLVSGFYLDPDQWEVKTERAGMEPLDYDVITVRPVMASGEASPFLVTKSGRRYLFHFIVGLVAMQTVTFEGASIAQVESREPRLPLPRPQP